MQELFGSILVNKTSKGTVGEQDWTKGKLSFDTIVMATSLISQGAPELSWLFRDVSL